MDDAMAISWQLPTFATRQKKSAVTVNFKLWAREVSGMHRVKMQKQKSVEISIYGLALNVD